VRFFLTTNWHATVRTASKEADVLVVGAMLGGAGAGLYAVTKQVASLLSRAGDPLYQAVYPELARLWAAGERAAFRRLLDRATGYGALAAILCCVAFALWGRPAMGLVLGAEYAVAYPATVVYLAAAGIGLATFAFHPAALAMDRPGESFGVLAACTAFYFALLVPLTEAFGLAGASTAYVAFYAAWAAALRWRLAVLLREAQR
jgi:O-antigen/teichoic acid export membrane protein